MSKRNARRRVADFADGSDSPIPRAKQSVKSATKTPVWQKRTGGGLHPALLAYSETTHEDRPFILHDLAGSSAHVLGLIKAGLLTKAEAKQLLQGLRAIRQTHEEGSFALDLELEDVHMNIESSLTAMLGDTGRKLHSGRSRNDQVATCITLYARQNVARLAAGLHSLAGALAAQAKTHTASPWVARTHGQPAQPATYGWLLAAHAARIQELATKSLETFERIGESPLGSGAVAGSTLPLDPAYTAKLMGLRAPRSALLATGTRDVVLESCLLASHVGTVVASLAQDLIDGFSSGALKLPSGYTTGSSLMPQKRNPDALELARGRGKALAGPLAAVQGILGGLGLGYMRDFQLTKPYLAAALHDACTTVELLGPLVEGMTYDAKATANDWSKPGIVATDVAEALVKQGVAFRTAYGIVATAFAQVETGKSFQAALEAQKLPRAQLAAALGALQPDPARRATVGGPAPTQVASALRGLAAQAKRQASFIAAAKTSAEQPFILLSAPIETLVNS
ncbi:MAG: argininosuccinate lyase [Candidatus Thermoplasmatota archaeon]